MSSSPPSPPSGMNYICGFIVLHTLKYDLRLAFWLFVSVMKKAGNLFVSGIPGLLSSPISLSLVLACSLFSSLISIGFNKCCAVFSRLLSGQLPQLAAYLNKHEIPATMYTQTWFLSLFCQDSIPFQLSSWIWDHFLLVRFLPLFPSSPETNASPVLCLLVLL
jgi:hypothetical protein